MYELFKEFVRYEPQTGKLFWVKSPKRGIEKDSEVGSKNKRGYIETALNGNRITAHRLAWLLYYKSMPEKNIDHINGIIDDNRIENLRDISQRENCNNQIKHRKGHLQGSHLNKVKKRYSARMRCKGKKLHLGSFASEEEAHIMYLFCKELN